MEKAERLGLKGQVGVRKMSVRKEFGMSGTEGGRSFREIPGKGCLFVSIAFDSRILSIDLCSLMRRRAVDGPIPFIGSQ